MRHHHLAQAPPSGFKIKAPKEKPKDNMRPPAPIIHRPKKPRPVGKIITKLTDWF
jgi:hypothetical protein